MWYTCQVDPALVWGECFGDVLPVCVTSVLQDGILEQLHLCQLVSNVPNEKGTKESTNNWSLPWKLVNRLIIRLMCCYTLNSVFRDGWNPFQCSLPLRAATWHRIIWTHIVHFIVFVCASTFLICGPMWSACAMHAQVALYQTHLNVSLLNLCTISLFRCLSWLCTSTPTRPEITRALKDITAT